MSEDLIAANLRRGTPDHLRPCPPAPGLQADILAVLKSLRSPTKQFVKSRRIARELDGNVGSIQIGQQLRLLADGDDPPIEEWCPGNGSRTWRILLEVADECPE